jgi:hypothetical protein
MIECFVDLTYRGLQLGRRVKLTQVRPSTGYLEIPAPMPVGTAIAIATDEGVVLEAIVTGIHEQVGGSDRTPGMTVAPVFDDTGAHPYRGAGDPRAWWRARVALPEEEAPAPRNRPVTVRPRSHTVPQPPPPAAVVDPDPPALDPTEQTEPELPGSKTTVTAAVDPELLEQLTRTTGEIDQRVRRTGEHDVVDDGKQTVVMDAIDPAALGLDVGGSGSVPMSAVDDDDGDDKKSPSGVKKRRKKR